MNPETPQFTPGGTLPHFHGNCEAAGNRLAGDAFHLAFVWP